jgi:hypothetical protein
MKKFVRFVLVSLLVLSLLVLSGCSLFLHTKPPQIMSTYSKENAPSQIAKAGKQWVLLHNTYGSKNYYISVGENLDSTKNIYSVDDVSIWYFEANNNGIVWCEESQEFYTYKIYVFETQKAETIFQVAVDKGYQPQNIGIYLSTVYYCAINYDQEVVQVITYDITTKTTNAVYKVKFDISNQPYSINLENEYLSFVCSEQIKVLNLQNNEPVFDSTLPEAVKYVYSVSYDSKNDTCALYYADNDSEDIGILKEGQTEIASVFTFSQNHYAYQDKIDCHDGHIYWIAQANVSGKITDHYTFIDYNYLDHKPTEIDRTFSFYRNESELYLLRFNESGDYTHIDLCQP